MELRDEANDPKAARKTEGSKATATDLKKVQADTAPKKTKVRPPRKKKEDTPDGRP